MTTEHTIILDLPYSGYKIGVTPLPPHYMDVIEDMYQLMEYPKRMLKLAAGDIVPWSYTPPAECPDEHENPEDYELYVRWHHVDGYNTKIHELRKKARIDMLYSTCVNILEGKYKVEDEQWVLELEAPFVEAGRHLDIKHAGYRKLLFIKAQVIRHTSEKSMVLENATYQEVTMQGIESALRNFRSDVRQYPITEAREGYGKEQSRTQPSIVGD